jgi:hypothetical protein
MAAKRTKMAPSRNEHKRSLFHRAGTADVAVAVDTRPKRASIGRGKGSYRRMTKSEETALRF